jgi:hypothetical protein
VILDRVMSAYDTSRIEHRVVDGSPESTYTDAVNADFMDALRTSPLARLLFGVRGGAERVVGLARRNRSGLPAVPVPPERLRLADLSDHGDWIKLAEDRPNEVVFGAIGRFWAGETTWEQVAASGFSDFQEPGYAKIACNFSFRSYGERRTLVSYEARTQATDGAARRGLFRYWRLVDPFVGVVMRAMLRVVARDAERSAPPRSTPDESGYPTSPSSPT